MSEPVSNVEIEDVLSSIRRLVSEEHRSELRQPPKKSPVNNSRLVLTPALRVADFPEPKTESEPESKPELETVKNQEPVAEHAPQFEPAPESDPEPETDFGADIETAEDVVAEMSGDTISEPDWPETEDTTQSEEFAQPEDQPQAEGETDSEPVAETNPNPQGAPLWLLPEADLAEVSEPGDSQQSDATDDAPWRDPDATLFEAAQLLGAVQSVEDAALQDDAVDDDIAEDSTPENDRFTDQSPDMELADADQSESAEIPVEDAAETWQEETPAEAARPSAPDDDSGEAWHGSAGASADVEFDRTAALSAKIAALEATIGQTQDQWEPDGEIGDDYAGTIVKTIEWQDHDADEDSTVEPLRPPPLDLDPDPVAEIPFQAAPVDDPRDTLAADEAILDEESLRELVADIVRQELQGALGERITRNVRKLVRREIHRALTAQELD